MKSKYRFIVLISLAVFILSIVAWKMNYNASQKPATTSIQTNPAGLRPGLTLETASTQNGSAASSHTDGTRTERSDDIFTNPKELEHLRLVGTAVNAANAPCAVIENKKNLSQGLYTTGAEIEGATIIQIQSDCIILSYKGKNFKLLLEKTVTPETQLKTDELLKETPNPFVYTTQEDVEKAWDETQDLMTKIELDQNVETGESKGVIVKSVLSDSVFEKIGFKPGDILVKVDDMEMNIADDALEVYNCIRTKPAVEFTVIRNGEPNPLILEYRSDMMQK